MNKQILIILLFFSHLVYCQKPSDSSTYNSKDDFSLTAFPLIFYLPETSLAFGALGITVFNAGKHKAWRKSQVQLGLAITLKKQFLLFIPYELYIKQKLKLNGEIGYYRYFYNYYGIGNKSLLNDLETYNANFPRLISALSYRITPNLLFGLQYRFDAFNIAKADSLLTSKMPIGFQGGIVSTIGLAFTYDNRDDIFYPRSGCFLGFNSEHGGNYTGSNYIYSTFTVDASVYKSIFKNHVITANLYSGTSSGNLPFFNYYYLSSGKRGRGFNDRRFIDRTIMLLQTEYRFPIYKRFRGVAFASAGNVGNTYSTILESSLKLSYGAGLRFQLSKKQLNHLRLDVAHSYEGFQFYITIGEAF